MANWMRSFGATSQTGNWLMGSTAGQTQLYQAPLTSPSVFNFFRPGYVPPGSGLSAQNLTGPEFQITNESTVAGYVNFMQRTVSNGVGDVKGDYTAWMALAADSAALLADLNLVLAAGQIPATTLATLKTALDTVAVATDAGKLNRIYAAVTLVLAAPETIALK